VETAGVSSRILRCDAPKGGGPPARLGDVR